MGAAFSEKFWGRGEFLYFSDNDIYFTPGWITQLRPVFNVKVIGGQRHPFHGINHTSPYLFGCGFIEITDAVAGYSQFMEWSTWDKYGPFDAHTVGVCKSEDFAFCQKIVKDGGMVGYIDPPAVYHTGLTNSEGKAAIGSEQFQRVEGVLYQ